MGKKSKPTLTGRILRRELILTFAEDTEIRLPVRISARLMLAEVNGKTLPVTHLNPDKPEAGVVPDLKRLRPTTYYWETRRRVSQ